MLGGIVAVGANGEPIMSKANGDLLISADAHVAENEDLRARLPESLRERMPLMVLGKGDDFDVETNGEVRERSSWKKLSARDRELEFRTDPSFRTDLDRRMRDMAREGVDAQVIFPNVALDCGGSHHGLTRQRSLNITGLDPETAQFDLPVHAAEQIERTVAAIAGTIT